LGNHSENNMPARMDMGIIPPVVSPQRLYAYISLFDELPPQELRDLAVASTNVIPKHVSNGGQDAEICKEVHSEARRAIRIAQVARVSATHCQIY